MESDRRVRVLGLARSLHHKGRLLALRLQGVVESEGYSGQDCSGGRTLHPVAEAQWVPARLDGDSDFNPFYPFNPFNPFNPFYPFNPLKPFGSL